MADVIKQQWVGDSSEAQRAVKDLGAQILALENANAKSAAKMTKDMEKLRTQLQTTTQQLQAVTSGSGQAAQSAEGLGLVAQKLQGEFVGLISPWLKITAAIGAAKAIASNYFAFVQSEQARQSQAANSQKSIGVMQAELFNSFSGATREEKIGLASQASRIRKEAGFASEKPILAALIASGSSTQGNLGKSVEAVEYAAKLAGPGADPQTLIELAQAATDLERSTGVPGMKENLSFMLAAQEQHRAVGLKESATVIPRGVAALTSSLPARAGRDKKTDAAEAMAMLAVLSHGATDKEGNLSTTGAFPIAEDMAKFFSSGMDVPGMGRGGGPLHLEASEKPDTLGGQLKYLQSHPEEAEMFLQSVHAGRKILLPTFRRLLRNDPEASRLFSGAREAGLRSFGPEIYEQTVGDLRNGTPEMKAMFSDAAIEGNAEASQKMSRDSILAEARKLRDANYQNRDDRSFLGNAYHWLRDKQTDYTLPDKSAIFARNQADIAAEARQLMTGPDGKPRTLDEMPQRDRARFEQLGVSLQTNRQLAGRYLNANAQEWSDNEVGQVLANRGRTNYHPPEAFVSTTAGELLKRGDIPAQTSSIMAEVTRLLEISDEKARMEQAHFGGDYSYNPATDRAYQTMRNTYGLSDDQITMLEMRRDFERFNQRKPDLAPAARAEARGGGER